jgi:CHASE2 domain-containing sensor protein
VTISSKEPVMRKPSRGVAGVTLVATVAVNALLKGAVTVNGLAVGLAAAVGAAAVIGAVQRNPANRRFVAVVGCLLAIVVVASFVLAGVVGR